MHGAMNVAIRNAAADTDDHGGKSSRLSDTGRNPSEAAADSGDDLGSIINANRSY